MGFVVCLAKAALMLLEILGISFLSVKTKGGMLDILAAVFYCL